MATYLSSASRNRCGVFVAALLLASLAQTANSAEPARAFSTEEMFTALIEPNLEADGRLAPEKREAIRRAARKILDDRQMHDLESRLEALAAKPSAAVQVSYMASPAVQAAPAPAVSMVDAAPAVCLQEMEVGDGRDSLFDNLWLFAGLDGSKQPQDLGLNANMGGRTEVNWGLPLLERFGLGLQIGASENYSDSAVHVVDQVEGTHNRWQTFTTLGVFQRTDFGLKWGIAWDYLHERYYDNMDLSQWRGQVGYNVTENNEVGAWFTVGDHNDSPYFLTIPLHVAPLSQCNFYWQHTWANRAQTAMWLGVAEGHGREVISISTEPPTRDVLTYGASVYVPLSDHFALYGAANFLTPADTGTVDAYLGIVFTPGSARDARDRRFAPLLPVANNPYFAVDLRH